MSFIMVLSEVMETLSMLRLKKHTAFLRYGSPESWLTRTGMGAPTLQIANPSAATQQKRYALGAAEL